MPKSFINNLIIAFSKKYINSFFVITPTTCPLSIRPIDGKEFLYLSSSCSGHSYQLQIRLIDPTLTSLIGLSKYRKIYQKIMSKIEVWNCDFARI